MTFTVALVAPGNMGAAVARRLAENGVRVLTSLTGRSAASEARARAAGMVAVELGQLAEAEIVLSILPPAQALGFAQQMAAVLAGSAGATAAARAAGAMGSTDSAGAAGSAGSARAAGATGSTGSAGAPGVSKPVFVDCNAVSPDTAREIAAVFARVGVPFVDGAIIGLPPKPGEPSPHFYMAGETQDTARALPLTEHGLDVRVLDGPVGAASALKMCYAGINKGLAAIASVMILAAARSGASAALYQEMSESLPGLLSSLGRQVPDMLPKAYRWVAEMREIAAFAGSDPAAHAVYVGFSELFDRVARDVAQDGAESAALKRFFPPP
jgi:3-hydroxyisobutyrate dehydrogenase-like beta-hydroxyacid dehydrogenase